MKLISFLFLLLTIVSCTNRNSVNEPDLARVEIVTDSYFGKEIHDPYRYMENLKDTAVQSWMKQQTDYSRTILNSIPGRQSLIDKMIEFESRVAIQRSWPYITTDDKYFYEKQSPADKTSKLFYRTNENSEEILLFDPETYSSDTSKAYQISYFLPNFDGSKVAISVIRDGLELPDVLLMDVKNKTFYSEILKRGYNYRWTQDGNRILYQRINAGDPKTDDIYSNVKIFQHIPNTSVSSDIEIFSNEKYPEFGLTPGHWNYPIITHGCQYIFIYASTMARSMTVYYAPVSELHKDKINFKPLIKPEDEVYRFRVTDKDLYVLSAKDAPNYKILKTSLKDPDIAHAQIIVNEDPKSSIGSYTITKDGLYYTLTINGVQEKIYFLQHNKKEMRELKTPMAAGSVYLRNKGFEYSDIWVGITGWASNNKRYRYVAATNEFKAENFSEEIEYPEYKDLIVEEVMVPSHDGIEVPLSLVYKEGLKMNGANPVIITAYGCYGYSWKPEFDAELLLFAHEGGIVATAHVRGGGELGKKWRLGGFKTTKPNTWKDLIACAEYLITENYSTNKKIAIHGMSGGGITIGRAMTERPELFAAAIPKVGAMNAIRFEESAGGELNVTEFGTVKDSVECMALLEMDAYHHLSEGVSYPATLLTAGMNDTRVIAWQPAKFTARLNAVNASDKPILFRVDYEAGHGIMESKQTYYNDMADILSFALWQTGHPNYQVK